MVGAIGDLYRQGPDDYGMTSQRTNAMLGYREMQFHPSVVNGYSHWERQAARRNVIAGLEARNEIKWDPEMAKRQAYPILDRMNYAYTSDNTGLANADFSVLQHKVRDHMLKGTALNYGHMEQTARAMDSMKDTRYGEVVRNFMASAHIGSMSLAQEAGLTLSMALSSMPPPEIAMFHYQQMYLANGNDSAGFAHEVEAMNTAANRFSGAVYGELDGVKGMLRDFRTDEYNQLQYFADDPLKSALWRPDKLTGDLFEKVIPAVVKFCIPGKIGSVMQSQKGPTLLMQFGYIARSAFNTTGTEVVLRYQRNPELVDKNPDFHRYVAESPYAQTHPEQARQYFIEGEARKAGVQSALLGIGSAIGSYLLTSMTKTGTEGPMLKWVQEFVMDQVGEMTNDAVNGVDMETINKAAQGGDIDRKPKY